MQVHHFKPEADDPLYESPEGPLIWQLGAQGCRVRAHDHGAVVTTMPLSELMERARISEKAKAADQSPDFSRLIRVGVPSPQDQAAR